MEKYRESIELAERITRYLEGKLSDMEELELEKELQGIPEGEKLLERIRDPKAIVAKKKFTNLLMQKGVGMKFRKRQVQRVPNKSTVCSGMRQY